MGVRQLLQRDHFKSAVDMQARSCTYWSHSLTGCQRSSYWRLISPQEWPTHHSEWNVCGVPEWLPPQLCQPSKGGHSACILVPPTELGTHWALLVTRSDSIVGCCQERLQCGVSISGLSRSSQDGVSTMWSAHLVHVQAICSVQHFLPVPGPPLQHPLDPPVSREHCVLSQAWVLRHLFLISTALCWVPCTLVLEHVGTSPEVLSPTAQAFMPESRAE